MAVQQRFGYEKRIVLIQVLASRQTFLEGSVCDLLSDEQKRRLICGYIKNFDNKLRSHFLKFLQILWKLNVGMLHYLDGDRQIGLILVALPDCIVGAAE